MKDCEPAAASSDAAACDLSELREAIRIGLHAVEWMATGLADFARDIELCHATNPNAMTARILKREAPFLRDVLAKVDALMQLLGDHIDEPSELDVAVTTPAFRAVRRVLDRQSAGRAEP